MLSDIRKNTVVMSDSASNLVDSRSEIAPSDTNSSQQNITFPMPPSSVHNVRMENSVQNSNIRMSTSPDASNSHVDSFLLGIDFDSFTADGELNFPALSGVFESITTPHFPNISEQIAKSNPGNKHGSNSIAFNNSGLFNAASNSLLATKLSTANAPQKSIPSTSSLPLNKNQSEIANTMGKVSAEVEYTLKLFFEELREDCVLISLSISAETTLGIIRKLLEGHIDCAFTLWKSGFLLEQALDHNTIVSLFAPSEEKILLVRTVDTSSFNNSNYFNATLASRFVSLSDSNC